jgi:hypothetical protein
MFLRILNDPKWRPLLWLMVVVLPGGLLLVPFLLPQRRMRMLPFGSARLLLAAKGSDSVRPSS